MGGMFLLALLLTVSPITGDAAFNHRIEEAAMNRGMSLDGYAGGVALMDCDDLGEEVWVKVGGAWTGPWLSVDCAAEHDRAWLDSVNRVVDLPWSFWNAVGLPLVPYPVAVSFEEPRYMLT